MVVPRVPTASPFVLTPTARIWTAIEPPAVCWSLVPSGAAAGGVQLVLKIHERPLPAPVSCVTPVATLVMKNHGLVWSPPLTRYQKVTAPPANGLLKTPVRP